MFNLQGSELIIILLLALVVLGPEKLPDAMRKAGKMYADLKKMASGFQQEFNAAVEEPLREARETADLLRDSADFSKLAQGERDEKPKSAEMSDVGPLAPADPDAVPVDDIPFSSPSADVAPPTGTDGFASLPALDATGDGTPREHRDDAPGEPGDDARGEPGDDAPGEPGDDAPGEPGDDAPGEPGDDAPGERGGDAAGERRGDAPGEPGGDAAGETEQR